MEIRIWVPEAGIWVLKVRTRALEARNWLWVCTVDSFLLVRGTREINKGKNGFEAVAGGNKTSGVRHIVFHENLIGQKKERQEFIKHFLY